MKNYMNKVLLVLLCMATINVLHADLATELLMESRANQMNKAMSEHAKNQQREKELELEALLLIDSIGAISDCIKNAEFLKLKNIYDKMRVDPLYVRPTKDQINEWRDVIKEHIAKVKIDNKNAKVSSAYLKSAIKNGIALGISAVASMASITWGSNVISKSNNVHDNHYLAKYAIDLGVLVGWPLTSILLLKFAWQLIPHNQVETLQKMNSLLLLFEQLNETNS